MPTRYSAVNIHLHRRRNTRSRLRLKNYIPSASQNVLLLIRRISESFAANRVRCSSEDLLYRFGPSCRSIIPVLSFSSETCTNPCYDLEYSVPVLGLIFLRYADHKFAQAEKRLGQRNAGRRKIRKTDYQAQGVFYIPDKARFGTLLNFPEGAGIRRPHKGTAYVRGFDRKYDRKPSHRDASSAVGICPRVCS